MLGYDKFYSVYTSSDFTSNISKITNSCSHVDSTELLNNQYTFLADEECLYLKKDTTRRGYVQFNLDNVKKGDEIYISFEYKNLTNNCVEISVTNGLSAPNVSEMFDTTTVVNEWGFHNSKIIYPYEDVENCNINIGLWTHLGGEYKIRKIKIVHKAQVAPVGLQVKTYAIKKDATSGFIIVNDFSNSGGSIERYQDHLILHFTQPFVGNKRPVGSVGMDMYQNSKDYIVRISGTTSSQASIYFYKVSDGSLVTDPNTIPADVWAFLTFIVV